MVSARDKERCLVWVDSYLGIGAWLAPLSWVVLPYWFFQIFPPFFAPVRGLPLVVAWIMDVLILLFIALLFVISIVLFRQAMKTVQRVEYNEEYFIVHFYYGRKKKFYPHQIEKIQHFALRPFDKLASPLARDAMNYRVVLNDGSYFDVSGKMSDSSGLICLLEEIVRNNRRVFPNSCG